MSDLLAWARGDTRRTLGAALIVVCAGIIGYSYIADPKGDDGSTLPPAHHQHIGTPAPSGSPTQPARSPSAPRTTAAPTAREEITSTVQRYIVAFFSKGGTTAEWHRSIDRYSTPSLAELNADTARTEVPTAHLLSLRVTGFKSTFAEVQARMSGGMTLFVAVVRDGPTWKVNEFAPEGPE